MIVTKNLAEYCTLLIDEIYGELPSRIFAALLHKGRSNIGQLAQNTSMTPRQIRHGLAVLLQHNLLYYYVDKETKIGVYEANIEHAYNLTRVGKILEMVEVSYGPAAKDVMQNLLFFGQSRISDFIAAYQGKINRKLKESLEKENGQDSDGLDGIFANSTKGASHQPAPGSDLEIKNATELNSVLCSLVDAELIDVVHEYTHQSPNDILKEVEKEVTEKHFPQGMKGARGKAEYEDHVAMSLRAIREESKVLKRQLEFSDYSSTPALPNKRRKIFNGVSTINGDLHDHDEDSKDSILDPTLDRTKVIRVNYEKCIVDLRNRRLVQFAAEMLGEVTAYVYGVLMRELTKDLTRCHPDPRMDVGDNIPKGPRTVTTSEILNKVKATVDLSAGIGKAHRSHINTRAAEKVQKYRSGDADDEADVNGDASSDEDEDDSDDSDLEMHDEPDHKGNAPELEVNGGRESKVKFADSSGREPRVDRTAQLRQHLLLLADSKQGFVRHCGPNEWTVDFDGLIRSLKESELDAVIERSSGRYGLRLAHILRSKGKLDEKSLPNLAFMTKADVQRKLLEMEVHGFVHIQEVPKDNKHDVKKSYFLWFCDVDRSLTQILDQSYKSMIRSMQVLEVLRQKDKDVLMLTQRTDVKGREKDVMRKEYYDRYSRFLNMEKKLLGQVQRLDDLVGVLRDY